MNKIPFAAAIILALFCSSYAGEKNKNEEASCFTTKNTENMEQRLAEAAKLKKEGKLKKIDLDRLGLEEVKCNMTINMPMDMPSMDMPKESKPNPNYKPHKK